MKELLIVGMKNCSCDCGDEVFMKLIDGYRCEWDWFGFWLCI